MIAANTKSLFRRLNRFCTRSLETAAGQCVSRGHYEVCVEHVLAQLLEDPTCDIPAILRHFEIDSARVQKSLQRILESLKSGNSGRPVFSPRLLDWIEESWLIGSVDLDLTEIRSGVLLAALVRNLGRYFAGEGLQSLESIRLEELQRHFFEITAGSSEDTTAQGKTATSAAATADTALGKFTNRRR